LLLASLLGLAAGCQAHHPAAGSADASDAKKMAELERMLQLQQDQINKIYSDSRDDRSWPSGLTGGETTLSGDQCDTLMRMEIYYTYAEYKPDDQGRRILDEVAKRMAETPASWVEIYGYADPTGDPYRSFIMSNSRSFYAMAYLVQKFAIPIRRVNVLGLGFGLNGPKYSTDIGGELNKNRRIEVFLKAPSRVAAKTGEVVP
jgi:outer membrane protein OmpA-like peptidoglycan-associated protein